MAHGLCIPNFSILFRILDSEQLGLIDAGIQDLMDSTRVNGEICVDIRRIDRNGENVPDHYVLVESFSG